MLLFKALKRYRPAIETAADAIARHSGETGRRMVIRSIEFTRELQNRPTSADVQTFTKLIDLAWTQVRRRLHLSAEDYAALVFIHASARTLRMTALWIGPDPSPILRLREAPDLVISIRPEPSALVAVECLFDLPHTMTEVEAARIEIPFRRVRRIHTMGSLHALPARAAGQEAVACPENIPEPEAARNRVSERCP